VPKKSKPKAKPKAKPKPPAIVKAVVEDVTRVGPAELVTISPDDMLAEVKRLVMEPASKSELESVLRAIRVGHEEKIKMAAMAVAHHRLGRILEQLATVSRLEGELSDVKRLGPAAKTTDLLRALQYYSTEIYRALDFLFEQLSPEEIAKEDFDFYRRKDEEEIQVISREDREKLRRLVKDISDGIEREFPVAAAKESPSGPLRASSMTVLPKALPPPRGRDVSQ